jgi:acyl-CoA thioester hydrolase
VKPQLAGPTDRKPPYRLSAFTRVGFSDTDAQGIVYYGRYLPYFDLARVEYLRHLGLLNPDLGPRQFVARASMVEYHAPARFDDLLEVFVRVRRLGRSSMSWSLAVHRDRDDTLMCTSEQTLVLVELEARRPTPIPEEFRRIVRAFEGANLEEPAGS